MGTRRCAVGRRRLPPAEAEQAARGPAKQAIPFSLLPDGCAHNCARGQACRSSPRGRGQARRRGCASGGSAAQRPSPASPSPASGSACSLRRRAVGTFPPPSARPSLPVRRPPPAPAASTHLVGEPRSHLPLPATRGRARGGARPWRGAAQGRHGGIARAPRGAQGRRRGEGRPRGAARPGRPRPWPPPRLAAPAGAEPSCSFARTSQRWKTNLTCGAHLAVREATGPSCQRGRREEEIRGRKDISPRLADRALTWSAVVSCHVSKNGKNVRFPATLVLNLQQSV